MKIEIKNRFSGDVLFSHEAENNTMSTTVSEAVKQDANLRGADLGSADLRDANLRGADLRNANLWDANIRGADLRGADLWCAYGNSKEIKTIQTNYYTVVMTKKVMQIGCKQFTVKQWKKFDDEEISNMDCKALEFWKEWKKLLFLPPSSLKIFMFQN